MVQYMNSGKLQLLVLLIHRKFMLLLFPFVLNFSIPPALLVEYTTLVQDLTLRDFIKRWVYHQVTLGTR